MRSLIHGPWMVAGLIFLVNLPFGYWRAGVKKFSPSWFGAVHVPVVLAIAIRLLAGLGFRLVLLPMFVGAFFFGQLAGGRVRQLVTQGPSGS